MHKRFHSLRSLALLVAALIGMGAAAIASAANQTFIFSGTQGPVSTTLTNPYDGATITLNGTYNVNNSTYSGQGIGNTLLMTNATDFLTLDSALAGHSPNVQTVNDVQRIITGNGDDVVDLASANFTLPAITIFGGTGTEIIWTNSGDTTVNAGTGNTTIRAAAGNDIINGGIGSDIIDAGTGNNTVNSGGGDDSLTFNVAQDHSFTNIYNGGIGTDALVLHLTASEAASDAADIAAAQAFIAAHNDPTTSTGATYTFSSFPLTISNVESLQGVPEPSMLGLLGLSELALLRRRRAI